MDCDVRGRLRKFNLRLKHGLYPLIETIINSIDAIEERGTEGRIDVHVQRDKLQATMKDDESHVALGPITGFVIQDDGCGFTDRNYESFQTSDSTIKKGGKGVGRFLWLLAFEGAEVESIYEEGGAWKKRIFEFRYTKDGVEGHRIEPTDERRRRTEVRLIGFKPEYRDATPKTIKTISRHIVEHCMELFVLDNCPQIFLHDAEEKSDYDLERMFKNEVLISKSSTAFKIKGKMFRLTHIMTACIPDADHRLCFCARGRAVVVETLKSKIPNLQRGLTIEGNGKTAFYSGRVSGDYLDDRVNSERTKFDLFDELELDITDELTFPEIREASLGAVRKELAPFLDPIQKEKEDRIRTYVQTQAPQYRPLLKHRGKELDDIPPNIGDAELDLELYRRNQRYDSELREVASKLLSPDKDGAYEGLKKHFGQFIEEWNDQSISKLAQYVIHRKITLSFLHRRLQIRDDKKYPLEESVHKIVFPLRTTSDDVPTEEMNLWIIDERLAYHYFLASDKYLDSLDKFNYTDHDRPDILIFNRPFAFADTPPTATFPSIVIVEFKRPMRGDYNADDPDKNPVSQVYRYVREIRSGTAVDNHGRPITVYDTTRFYAYVICDLTLALRTIAEDAGMIPSPDSQGYFFFNRNLNTYLEVMSFNKLVDDAKKRNAAFFDKLNLPK